MRKRNASSNMHSYRNANSYQYTRRTVYESPDWFNAHYESSEFSWKGYYPNTTDKYFKSQHRKTNEKQTESEQYQKDKMNFDHVYKNFEDFDRQLRQREQTNWFFCEIVVGIILFIFLCCCAKLIVADYEPDDKRKK